ncbi:spore germination protein [Gracilibacillus boraciitolerans JCM 21714]|uniref:Spore germination protein n=1 Tax=Gracilibacillus boraciitolerans JCM 21714 TaxID=1298598 RepID=W4VHW6_9BACI|nr:Ger(x)C family spore germination C-terminal domain-containing protein [Gracilibacillus boraciitolerans]GAE92403.1 spore germination protein [Gracilibacillus boraciitolerans JCM 21714]
MDQSYINDIEKSINKRIEQLVNTTVEKAQNELQVDFLGFRSLIRQKHYDDWKKIENNWEYGELLFSKSSVEVSVNTMLRNIGSSDKAKD